MAVENTDTEAATETLDGDNNIELEDMEIDLLDESVESEDKEDSSELDKLDEDESEDDQANIESEQQEELESDDEKESDAGEKEQPKSDEDKQKAYNKMMAEKRIQEKQARESNIKQQQQDYLAEAEDEKDLALRQLQVDAYDNKIERNTNKLSNSYERAVKDFPILADQTPEIKAEVDAAIDAFQAMYVTVDSFGNTSEVRGDLYQYLQNKADSIEKLTQIGARKQVDNKSKEKSKTFTPPSRSPKESKKDPLLDAFDEEFGKY